MNQIISIRNTVLLLVISTTFFTISTPVFAQAIGESNPSSGSYGSSTNSDFQNAGFRQGGTSPATSAGGATTVLKQVNPGTIVVTGAPALPPVITAKTNKLPLYGLITIAAFTALALIGLFINKTRKTNIASEQAFVSETTMQASAPKNAKSVTKDQLPSEEPKTKKPKKSKKKHKKHHR
jgi:hypothetical protein